jgi:hypothetical protein
VRMNPDAQDAKIVVGVRLPEAGAEIEMRMARENVSMQSRMDRTDGSYENLIDKAILLARRGGLSWSRGPAGVDDGPPPAHLSYYAERPGSSRPRGHAAGSTSETRRGAG